MTRRTRQELIDLYLLIFSIRLKPAPRYASPEALAEHCAVPVALIGEIDAAGLLSSEPSHPGRGYDAEDARVVAIIAELVDLGATSDDLQAFGAHVIRRCGRCTADPCPTRCDSIETLRALLSDIATRARSSRGTQLTLARIKRAIASIDALADLI